MKVQYRVLGHCRFKTFKGTKLHKVHPLPILDCEQIFWPSKRELCGFLPIDLAVNEALLIRAYLQLIHPFHGHQKLHGRKICVLTANPHPVFIFLWINGSVLISWMLLIVFYVIGVFSRGFLLFQISPAAWKCLLIQSMEKWVRAGLTHLLSLLNRESSCFKTANSELKNLNDH